MSKISSQTKLQIIVVILVIAAAILVGMTSLSQPAIMPASAPAEAFSAERAMVHTEIITQEPHPVGSPEIEEVRDYIVAELEAMGLSPEIQQATSMVDLRGDVIAGTVYNVIAQIPGTNPGQAIALNAHYDTMPQTPGASDCGSCVATLLETARALMASPSLQNDVILVFADAEEYGPGLGSAAFVEQHALADDVGVLLNFEGVGTTGPSLIFRTSNDSGWLVRELVQATSLPVGQSWLHEILGMTPIGTDLIRYRDAGIDGIDFAYLTEGSAYHTMLDNPETIDARAIQHNGDYALSLTHHLGNQDLSEAGDFGGDAVYFSLVRGTMVTYPATWTIPLAVVVTALLVGVGIVGGGKTSSPSGVFAGPIGLAAGCRCSGWPRQWSMVWHRSGTARVPVDEHGPSLQCPSVSVRLHRAGRGYRRRRSCPVPAQEQGR
jgi:hypothetical protein